MIVSLKRSGVSAASRKTERVLLPRTMGSVEDLIELLINKVAAQDNALRIESLVIDFADAFWQIPLGELERRFTVFEFDGSYYVFQRAPQGSRGAPLLWARTVALACRSASLCPGDVVRLTATWMTPSSCASGQLRRTR